MTERLRRLTPADLDDAQRAVYDSIVGGPRARGTQLFPLADSAGALAGPFGLMLHAPELGAPLQELGAAIRYRTTLSDRSREIAILLVAAATHSEFERYAHERLGRTAGLSEDELTGLRSESFTSPDPGENAVAALSTALLRGESLDDDEYAHVAGILGDRQVLEVTVLVGYYRTLAQMLDVFGVGGPDEDSPR